MGHNGCPLGGTGDENSSKSLSENPGRPPSGDGELQVEKCKVVDGGLFPPGQQASGAVRPRVQPFHHPPSRPASSPHRTRRLGPLPRDMDDVSSTGRRLADCLRVVALVRAQMLTTTSSRGTANGKALERLDHQLLVVHVGAGHGHSHRHTPAISQHRAFDPQFPAICGVLPRLFPPRAALWSWPHPDSATPSRSLSDHRIPQAQSATVCGTSRA